MKYKGYIIGKAADGEEEILAKIKGDFLDETIRKVKDMIPQQISRKDIEMIIIKREED